MRDARRLVAPGPLPDVVAVGFDDLHDARPWTRRRGRRWPRRCRGGWCCPRARATPRTASSTTPASTTSIPAAVAYCASPVGRPTVRGVRPCARHHADPALRGPQLRRLLERARARRRRDAHEHRDRARGSAGRRAAPHRRGRGGDARWSTSTTSCHRPACSSRGDRARRWGSRGWPSVAGWASSAGSTGSPATPSSPCRSSPPTVACSSCDAADDDDLYWACRGGGGGTSASSPPSRSAPRPSPSWRCSPWTGRGPPPPTSSGRGSTWQHAGPDELWSNCQLLSTGTGHATVRTAGMFVGSASTLGSLVDSLVARAWGANPPTASWDPSSTSTPCWSRPGCESLDVAQCHLTTQNPAGTLDRAASVASSAYVSALPPRGGHRRLRLEPWPISSQTLPGLGGGLVFDALGGAINAVKPGDTAFVHRNAVCGIEASVATGRERVGGEPGAVVVGAFRRRGGALCRRLGVPELHRPHPRRLAAGLLRGRISLGWCR